jgi:hypothetical protein
VLGTATNNQVVTYTLKFSQAITASTLTASDITVTNGTLVANSLTQVDSTTWTVGVTTPSGTGSGTTAISVANASYTSTSGATGLGGAASQTYGVEPTPSSTGSSGGLGSGVMVDAYNSVTVLSTGRYVLAYNEVNNPSNNGNNGSRLAFEMWNANGTYIGYKFITTTTPAGWNTGYTHSLQKLATMVHTQQFGWQVLKVLLHRNLMQAVTWSVVVLA